MQIREQQVRAGREILGDHRILRIAPDGVVEDGGLYPALAQADALLLRNAVGIDDAGALDHFEQAGGGERRRDGVLLFKVELLVFLVQVNTSVGHGQQSDLDFFHSILILS